MHFGWEEAPAVPPGSPWDGGWAAGSWPAEDFGWEEAPPGSRGTVAGLLEVAG